MITPKLIIEWDSPHYRDPPRADTLMLAIPWMVAVDDVAYWVPAGWPFDGASIPRLFWRVVGPPLRATYRRGALLHDACYTGLVRAYPFDGRSDIAEIRHALDEFATLVPHILQSRRQLAITRKDADDLLHVLARWNGTSAWRARLMYRAVRWFGGSAWRAKHDRCKPRKQDQAS